MNVAKTIMSQVKQIDRMAFMAWGAKEFVGGEDYLKFKVNCPKLKHGYVQITYNYGTDLYEIRFFKIRAMKFIIDEKVENVYAEDMVNVIDARVG